MLSTSLYRKLLSVELNQNVENEEKYNDEQVVNYYDNTGNVCMFTESIRSNRHISLSNQKNDCLQTCQNDNAYNFSRYGSAIDSNMGVCQKGYDLYKTELLDIQSKRPNKKFINEKSINNFYDMKFIDEFRKLVSKKSFRSGVHTSRVGVQMGLYRMFTENPIEDDFYLSLLSWSSQNVLAMGMGTSVVCWNLQTLSKRVLFDRKDNKPGIDHHNETTFNATVPQPKRRCLRQSNISESNIEHNISSHSDEPTETVLNNTDIEEHSIQSPHLLLRPNNNSTTSGMSVSFGGFDQILRVLTRRGLASTNNIYNTVNDSSNLTTGNTTDINSRRNLYTRTRVPGMGSTTTTTSSRTGSLYSCGLVYPTFGMDNECSNSSPSDKVTSVLWIDSTTLAVGFRSGTIELWDYVRNIKLRSLTKSHSQRVGILAKGYGENNGFLLSSGSRDHTIVNHDIRKPESYINTFRKHQQEVCGLCWQGRYLASGGNDNVVFIWDAACSNGNNHTNNSNSNNTITVGTSVDETNNDLSTENNKILRLTQRREKYTCFNSIVKSRINAKNATKQTIYTQAYTINQSGLKNFNNTTPPLVLKGHCAAIKALAWSPHNKNLLVSGGGTADRCLKFWDISTGKLQNTVDTGSQVCNVCWSPYKEELVSTHGYSLNQVIAWKDMAKQKIATFSGHSSRVLYLAQQPTGDSIATAAGDGTIRFWKVFKPATRTVLLNYEALRELSLDKNVDDSF